MNIEWFTIFSGDIFTSSKWSLLYLKDTIVCCGPIHKWYTKSTSNINLDAICTIYQNMANSTVKSQFKTCNGKFTWDYWVRLIHECVTIKLYTDRFVKYNFIHSRNYPTRTLLSPGSPIHLKRFMFTFIRFALFLVCIQIWATLQEEYDMKIITQQFWSLKINRMHLFDFHSKSWHSSSSVWNGVDVMTRQDT